MKKGINSWSFPPMSLKDTFALAADAGFEGVELAVNASGELALTSKDSEVLAVKNMAGEFGLSLYSLTCGLCWDYWLNDDDKAHRQKAKDNIVRQMETAKLLGADTVLVVPGVVNADFIDPDKKVDYQTAYDRSLESLNELKCVAEELQIQIGLENVWNKFLLSPMEMKDFIDKIGSEYVGSYLDVGNTVYCGYPEDWVRILGKRIRKVHFKDYRRQAGGLHGFVDLLAGDVNYPEVMKAFREIGYDGWVSAEMIPAYKYHTKTLIYNTSRAMDAILGR